MCHKKEKPEMKRKIVALVGCLIIVTVIMFGTASAEIRPERPSVGIFTGGYVFDFFQDIKHSPVFGLRAGYDLTDRWGLEGVFDYVRSENDLSKEDVNAYVYRLESLYYLMPDSRFVPFAAIGVGGITVAPDSSKSRNDIIADYGLGVKYFLSDRFSLRGDVRHIIDFNEDDFTYNHFEYTFGLTLHLGSGSKKTEPVKAAAITPPPVFIDSDRDGVSDKLDQCPYTPAGVLVDVNGCPKVTTKDSDGDGVDDQFDKCPNTPAGVSVDANGCPRDSDGDGVADYIDKCPNTPVGVTIDVNGCPKDSDGDGVADQLDKCPNTPVGVTIDATGCPKDSDGDNVADYLDKCPNTPAGATVDANGCPKDSDGDGVADYLDKCPDTLSGVKVDVTGCPIGEDKISIDLLIEFETGKDNIRPKYVEELRKVGDIMKSHPRTTAMIEGHTDNVGSDASNLKLSQRRADSVRKYLISHYVIEASRLTAKGYGESEPKADNSTKEGKARNRRVLATITQAKTNP